MFTRESSGSQDALSLYGGGGVYTCVVCIQR